MDAKTLERANELLKKIKQLQHVLECFEWEPEFGGHSRNPRLIIEFDRDGREEQILPMNLSDELINFLKAQIIKDCDILLAEFNTL